MFQAIELNAQLTQQRIERDLALSAERRRLTSESSLSIRRAIGYRIIEIGTRLAAEQSLESIRSR
jgi:hypothetical protein